MQSQEPFRCLLLSCSQAKSATPELLPALQRYDGPAFRVLRRFLIEVPQAASKLDIWIVSAQYGLISSEDPIPDYDRRMSPTRASELNEEVVRKLSALLSMGQYAELFVSMGEVYKLAIKGLEELVPSATTTTTSVSSSGKKLTELKTWLYQPYGGYMPIARIPEHNGRQRATFRLRGVGIELSHDEAIAKAKKAIQIDPSGSKRYQTWYAVIDGTPVAPKWLVSQLSGVPVRSFVADEARRVLGSLGIPVYHIGSSVS